MGNLIVTVFVFAMLIIATSGIENTSSAHEAIRNHGGLTVEHEGRVYTTIPRYSDNSQEIQWVTGVTIHNGSNMPIRYWTSDSLAFIYGFPTLEDETIEPGQSRNIPVFAYLNRIGNGVYSGNQIIRYRVEGEETSAEVPIFYTFLIDGEPAHCTVPWLLTYVSTKATDGEWVQLQDENGPYWLYHSTMKLVDPGRGQLMASVNYDNFQRVGGHPPASGYAEFIGKYRCED